MAAQVERGATRRAQVVPLLAVFLAGLVVGPMLMLRKSSGRAAW
jgi:hypothetical protein